MSAEQGFITAKFGGSSLADGERMKHVGEIVTSNADRRFIIVSAPGKRFTEDRKITDALILCNSLVEEGLHFDEAFEHISGRYTDIGSSLSVKSVSTWLDEVYKGIKGGNGNDWAASRGEWLNAKMFADYLGGAFVDAQRLIKFRQDGKLDPVSYDIIREQLADSTVYQVIPGFYGEDIKGQVKIFPRGGSDITGAIIARGVGAREYENWTDVPGVLSADPRIVKNPKGVPYMTFHEMRELGVRGFDVLQQDSVMPAYEANIPIHLRSTFQPRRRGTIISRERRSSDNELVIGIAGRSGYNAINIQKFGLNDQIGVGEEIFDTLSRNGVSYQHDITGVDRMSVIVGSENMHNQDEIMRELHDRIQPEQLSIRNGLGIVCVVGQRIPEAAGRLQANINAVLTEAGIPVKFSSYPVDSISITVGVDSDKLNDAIKVLYGALIQ